MHAPGKCLCPPVVAVIAALAAGCSAGHQVDLPAPDLTAFAETDAIIVLTEIGGRIRAPRNIISGRGDGANLAVKHMMKNCCHSVDPRGVILLPLVLAVALPLSAVIGAARAHSPGETSDARATFEDVANDLSLRASLGDRVAERMRVEMPEAWTCIETVTAAGPAPCPSARTPTTLMLNAQFWSYGTGRYDPAVTLTGLVEARLTRGEGEPVVMNWRYDSRGRSYFTLVRDDGQPLRAEIEAMLDELAAAIVRDIFLDPRPVSMKMRYGQGVNAGWIKPVGAITGIARRMAPGEVAPASFGADAHAVVTTKTGGPGHGGCAISAIDGKPAIGAVGASQHPGGTRIAFVSAGHHTFSVSCPSSGSETWDSSDIEVMAEAGRLYCTDGRIFTETSAAHRC